MQRAWIAVAFAVTSILLQRDVSADPAAETKPAAYALDAIPREVPRTGDLQCPSVDLVTYKGDTLKYKPDPQVYSGLRPRLAVFERVVRDAAIKVYGRAPERIVQLGGYGCRRMREHAGYLSEHALGNAIDVEGFDFGHIKKGATLPVGLDKEFANGFEVRVVKHWGKKTGHAKVHALFLRTIIEALAPRDDAFRVLLGPGYPGHANHFHFDVAPFKLIQIFEDGKVVGAAKAAG